MTTTHTIASSTILGEGSFWETIWWLGIAGIVVICLSIVKSLGLGRTIIVGLSLTVAWIPVFAILCLMGMMLGAASESYVERHGSSAVETSHVETRAGDTGLNQLNGRRPSTQTSSVFSTSWRK